MPTANNKIDRMINRRLIKVQRLVADVYDLARIVNRVEEIRINILRLMYTEEEVFTIVKNVSPNTSIGEKVTEIIPPDDPPTPYDEAYENTESEVVVYDTMNPDLVSELQKEKELDSKS